MIICIYVFLGLTIFQSYSQVPIFDDTGFNPYREHFNQAFNERIDPFTGNLILSYTDIYLPGKGGLDLKIQRTYNSKIFKSAFTGNLIHDSWVGVGWSLHMGRAIFPGTATKPIIEMPDGTKQQMYLLNDNSGTHVSRNRWKGDYENEGSTIVYRLYLTDGTRYTFKSMGVTLEFNVNYWPVTEIMDSNGNKIEIDYETAFGQAFIDEIIDSEGRTISFNYNTNDENKELLSIEVNNRTWQYEYMDISEIGRSLLEKVELPNGDSWNYEYNTSNTPKYELTKVVYPSGGEISYSYQTESFTLGGFTNDYRVITNRETDGPEIEEGTWSYSYDFGASIIGITTINAPLNRKTKFHYYGAGYFIENGNLWRIGLLQKKETLEGNSIMETVEYEWSNEQSISFDNFNTPPYQTQDLEIYIPTMKKVTTNRNGQDYVKEYDDFDSNGNPKTIIENGEKNRTISRVYAQNTSLINKNLTHLVKEETIEDNSNNSHEIEYNYDSDGNLTSLKKYGVETIFTYFSNGNLNTVKDDNNNIVTYSNYVNGQAENISYPEYSIKKDINYWGLPNWEENGNGNKTFYEYDQLNRIIEVDYPGTLATVTIDYDDDGLWSKATQGNGWIKYNYNGFGLIVKTENSEGIKTTTEYNEHNEKRFTSYPYDNIEKGDDVIYDGLGRLKKITHPDGSNITYNYIGNKVEVNNEKNNTTTYHYHSYDTPNKKLLIKVETQESTTEYDYDVLERITIAQQVNISREFEYNSKGFLVSQEHPENGKTTYTHDNIGNVISKKDANNNTILYTYDDNNRLTKMNYPTGTDTEFSYDNNDNAINISDDSGNYDIEYSASNRITNFNYSLDGNSFSSSYQYDNKDDLKKITYPTGREVNYNLDSWHRIVSIPSFITNIEYHPNGNKKKIVFQNGIETNFEFDPDRYWITDINASGASIQLQYSYDLVGNVTEIQDLNNSDNDKHFEYDAIDRIIEANGAWGMGEFDYDVLGNRMSKNIGSIATNYNYDNKNRLTNTTSNNSQEEFDYDYDNNGNVLGDSYFSYLYNFDNLLISVDNGGVAEYKYNSNKQKVIKFENGNNKTFYHYDIYGNIVAITNSDGDVIEENIYLNREIIASIRPTNESTNIKEKILFVEKVSCSPNPFSNLAKIQYSLFENVDDVEISASTNLGVHIETIVGSTTAGNNEVNWDFNQYKIPSDGLLNFTIKVRKGSNVHVETLKGVKITH